MANFDLEKYTPVDDRIAEFYRDFPNGAIKTLMVKFDGPEVVFEARVYRTPDEVINRVFTSGWAREVEGKSPVNRTSHVENCETSAIGRALANLGYSASAERPSRSEMLKVAQMQKDQEEFLRVIREVGPTLPDEAEGIVRGSLVNLKAYVRSNWKAIQEQHLLAREVSVAIETAQAVPAAPVAAERADGEVNYMEYLVQMAKSNPDVEVRVGKKTAPLGLAVKENWETITTDESAARKLAEAVQMATGTTFGIYQ